MHWSSQQPEHPGGSGCTGVTQFNAYAEHCATPTSSYNPLSEVLASPSYLPQHQHPSTFIPHTRSLVQRALRNKRSDRTVSTQPNAKLLSPTGVRDGAVSSGVTGMGGELCLQIGSSRPASSAVYDQVQSSLRITYRGQYGIEEGSTIFLTNRFYRPEGPLPLRRDCFEGDRWSPQSPLSPPLRPADRNHSDSGHIQLHPGFSLSQPSSQSSLLCPLPPLSTLSHPPSFRGLASSPSLSLPPLPNRQDPLQDKSLHPPNMHCDKPQPPELPSPPPAALPSTILRLTINLNAPSHSLTPLPKDHPAPEFPGPSTNTWDETSVFHSVSPFVYLKPLVSGVTLLT